MGDLGSIPRLGRSPGEGNGYPLQYSGLENSIDCTVHEESDMTELLSLSLSVLLGKHSNASSNRVLSLFKREN